MHAPWLKPGALVWIRQRRWRIDRVLAGRTVVRLDVSKGERRLTFLAPFDRPQAHGAARGFERVRPQSALARLARLAARDADARWPRTIVAADAGVLPHQLEPALAAIAGRCRILIADDVGLGKTVQAGLVIAELTRRDPSSRILVLAPAFLRDQWLDELRRRFRIEARAADRRHLDPAGLDLPIGESPWRQPGAVWVGSVDFLKQRHVAAALPPDPWDLVVVDEAHDVCGHSVRYSFVQSLTRRARRVVLLTATPHDGDASRFRRLLDVGRFDRDPADLVVFRRTRSVLGPGPARRVRWCRVPASDAEARVFAALGSFERAVLARTTGDGSLLLLGVLRKRALSTMAALDRTIGRRLAWLDAAGRGDAPEWSQPRLGFDDTDDTDLLPDDERDGLMAPSGLTPARERSRLRRLQILTRAAGDDRKVERVVRLVSRTSERVVVFSEFRDSIDALARRLRFGRSSSILHGGQDRPERARQLNDFLSGRATLLLATDVAGQGLNLQGAARWVVSLELPWNPARLEQRIGRVDRIGQLRDTHLTVLTRDDHAESGVLRRLARRALSAERAFAESLAGVTPPPRLIRQAIFRPAEAQQADASETVAVCRRWQRPARRVARLLVGRRRLAARCRIEETPAKAVFCGHPRAGRLVPAGSALVGLSIRFVSASGTVLEDRFVPVVVAFDAGAAPSPDVLSAAARGAVHTLIARRTRAIARRQLARARELQAREQRIHAALTANARPGDEQPGLFDQRTVRSIESRRAERRRLQDALTARIRGLRDEAIVSVGELEPRIVIVRLA